LDDEYDDDNEIEQKASAGNCKCPDLGNVVAMFGDIKEIVAEDVKGKIKDRVLEKEKMKRQEKYKYKELKTIKEKLIQLK